MSWALAVLLAAGLLGPVLLVLLPLAIKARQERSLSRLAEARRGRDAVFIRGILVHGGFRLPAVLAADAEGLEILPVLGAPRRVRWEEIASAAWGADVGGTALRDPDQEGPAPVLSLATSDAGTLVLAFRSSQAVPLAGALSKRLEGRAPEFPQGS